MAPPGGKCANASGFFHFYYPPDETDNMRCRTCPGWIWHGKLQQGGREPEAAGVAGRLFSFFLREESRLMTYAALALRGAALGAVELVSRSFFIFTAGAPRDNAARLKTGWSESVAGHETPFMRRHGNRRVFRLRLRVTAAYHPVRIRSLPQILGKSPCE